MRHLVGQRAALGYIQEKYCDLVPSALAHGSEAVGSRWLHYLFEYEHVQISSFICHLIIRPTLSKWGHSCIRFVWCLAQQSHSN